MGKRGRSAGKPTLDQFVADLMDTILGSGYPGELRYEDGQIVQIMDGKVVGVVNPANVFHNYAEAAKADRPAILEQFAQMVLRTGRKLPETYDLAKADLRPRIWARSALELERLRGVLGEGEGADLVSVPVGEHLSACLAYDWPDTVSSIPPSTLEEWGVPPYVALEDATANLDEATDGYIAVGEGFYIFASGDSYDASRILLIPRIEALEVNGRHVAMTPNRDALMVTGSEDAERLGMMAELAVEGLGDSYPLLGVPLVLEDGEWVEWDLPPDHEQRRAFTELRARWIGPLYTEQKEILDVVHEKSGIEEFVANFFTATTESGLVSYCVWGEGLCSLLPVTDKVIFAREEGDDDTPALGDWAKIMEIAGHLLEETDHYPKRYRTKGFPGDAALEAIGVGEL